MGAPTKLSKQPKVYEFQDFGIKFIDKNDNGVFDAGEKVKVVQGKKEFFVDLAKKDCPQAQKLKTALFGRADFSLIGLRFGKAQDFLSQYHKAEDLSKRLEDPNQPIDVLEAFHQGQAAVKQARHLARQLFEDPAGSENNGELAAEAMAVGLGTGLRWEARERAEREGDMKAAREFLAPEDPALKKVLEKKAEGMLLEIHVIAKERGIDAAKQHYRACLQELKAEGAPRELCKKFKKDFRGIAGESPVSEAAAPKTEAKAFAVELEHFRSALDLARKQEHKSRTISACADIKELFGRAGMGASSLKAVKLAHAEYKALRQEYQKVREEWLALQASFSKLSPEEQTALRPRMSDLEVEFRFYQQDLESAYHSAWVTGLDHNHYFPDFKVGKPVELPPLVEGYAFQPPTVEKKKGTKR